MVLDAIRSAAQLLPHKYNGEAAARLLIAIAYQASDAVYRKMPGSEGHGLWMCERGSVQGRDGIAGMMLTPGLRIDGFLFVDGFGVPWESYGIWEALEHNDVLAAGVARLMLGEQIPTTMDEGWYCYNSIWRPAFPRQDRWPRSWGLAGADLNDTEQIAEG